MPADILLIIPNSVMVISYTTVVVYSRDEEEVGFLAPKYHPKSSLKFPS